MRKVLCGRSGVMSAGLWVHQKSAQFEMSHIQTTKQFFLDIFHQFSGPFHKGFYSNCQILIQHFLPTSGDSVVNFSGSSSQIWHTLRKLLLFSGTDIAYFSFDFPI